MTNEVIEMLLLLRKPCNTKWGVPPLVFVFSLAPANQGRIMRIIMNVRRKTSFSCLIKLFKPRTHFVCDACGAWPLLAMDGFQTDRVPKAPQVPTACLEELCNVCSSERSIQTERTATGVPGEDQGGKAGGKSALGNGKQSLPQPLIPLTSQLALGTLQAPHPPNWRAL